MDCIVRGVAKSGTQLNDFRFTIRKTSKACFLLTSWWLQLNLCERQISEEVHKIKYSSCSLCFLLLTALWKWPNVYRLHH